MLRFEPPELQEQIAQAIRSLAQNTDLDIDSFSEEIINTDKKDFDPSSYPDQTITPETEILISLPESECQRPLARNYRELTELALELESAEFEGEFECRTKNRLLVLTDYVNSKSYEILAHAVPDYETMAGKELGQKLLQLNRREEELTKKLNGYDHADPNIKEARRNEWREILQEYRDVTNGRRRIEIELQGPFDRFFLPSLVHAIRP